MSSLNKPTGVPQSTRGIYSSCSSMFKVATVCVQRAEQPGSMFDRIHCTILCTVLHPLYNPLYCTESIVQTESTVPLLNSCTTLYFCTTLYSAYNTTARRLTCMSYRRGKTRAHLPRVCEMPCPKHWMQKPLALSLHR